MTTWDNMAAAALPYWGGPSGAPLLIKARENVVFRVTLADGREAALRLHRPGYQSRAAIEAELEWTSLLARSGLSVPPAFPRINGEWTVRVGDRIVSMVGWLEGEPIGAAERRLGGTSHDQRLLMRQVGEMVARLHDLTDRLGLSPDLPRPHWNSEGYLGPQPLWGRFWENPSFTPGERDLIQDARAVARGLLADCVHSRVDYGLIHGDVLRENILSRPQGLALIDFDDSGWGWRLYDLATAIVQSLEEPALQEISTGAVEGYRSVRGLSAADEARLPLFVMLRTFASAGWIATRAAPDDPRQRFYADRAIRMARHVLAGSSPFSPQ